MGRLERGFTLIELLVVIAIIAIIAGLIIVRVNNVSKETRVSKRISDMNKIKDAISIFIAKGGSVNYCSFSPPMHGCRTITSFSDATNSSIFNTSNGKYPNDYLSGGTYPKDPLNSSCNYSAYVDNGDGTNAAYLKGIHVVINNNCLLNIPESNETYPNIEYNE